MQPTCYNDEWHQELQSEKKVPIMQATWQLSRRKRMSIMSVFLGLATECGGRGGWCEPHHRRPGSASVCPARRKCWSLVLES